MRSPKKHNRVARYRNGAALVRQLARTFPDLAAQMPDPSRLPLYPLASRRDVLIYREKHTPRIKQGGRAHAR